MVHVTCGNYEMILKLEYQIENNHFNCYSLNRIPCDPTTWDCYSTETALENVSLQVCSVCLKYHIKWSEFVIVNVIICTLETLLFQVVSQTKFSCFKFTFTYFENMMFSVA